jgi:hypothetical protein
MRPNRIQDVRGAIEIAIRGDDYVEVLQACENETQLANYIRAAFIQALCSVLPDVMVAELEAALHEAWPVCLEEYERRHVKH